MQLTVRKRLYLSFSLLLLVILGLGFYAVQQFKTAEGYTNQIADCLTAVDAARSIETSLSDYRIHEFRSVIAKDAMEREEAQKEMAAGREGIENNLTTYQGLINSDTDQKLFNELKENWQRYIQLSEQMASVNAQNIKGELDEEIFEQAMVAYDATDEKIHLLVDYNKEQANQDKLSVREVFVSTGSLLAMISLLTVLLGAIASYVIGRSIVKPLHEMENVAQKVAAGDLTADDVVIYRQDELGSLAVAFNQMKNNLRQLIGQQNNIALELSETSASLAGQAQQTSAGAAENAATVEDIALRVDQVAGEANKLAKINETIAGQATAGTASLKQLNQQIEIISDSTDNTQNSVTLLNDTLMKVTQIVDVITDIAEQTNLLALNAAIEAARAGEQGRGFSVVAEEVRKLAEQAATSTKEIKQLIAKVVLESKTAVEAMSKGHRDVKAGVEVAGEVGALLIGIVNQRSELSARIKTIADSSEQVSDGVQNVASATEEQTAAMEEVVTATEHLNAIVVQMQLLVNKFKI
jgi:methyl-accepting chemotaxis protein